MLTKVFATMATVIALGTVAITRAKAETIENKVKDSVDDTTTHIKKTARAGKKKAREATGTDNLGKDAKDKANDVGDDVNNAVGKAKRD